jgi:hypothetical protein
LPKVKNATSYFKNGLKNRFRAIAIRADEHFPPHSIGKKIFKNKHAGMDG